MKGAITKADVETLVRLAIQEDIGTGDITSQAIFGEQDVSKAAVVSKQNGIVCGTEVVRYVYEIIDIGVKVTPLIADGDSISPGDRILLVEGHTISVLSGERIALNFLQRMTGIATSTAGAVSLLRNTNIALLDTRKTVPGLRKLDKYAVKTGGGTNHREALFDMVIIKDNHIKAAGSITRAVRMVRDRYGARYPVEVEAATLDEVNEAAALGVDIIMLDNMDISMMKAAITMINKRVKIEVSGNVDEDKIKEIAGLDIDYISMGSLTHSVRAFDLSMKFY
jgi:nicotinate-nucleotide pyrophosphorylase (carboxylating)